MNKYHRQIILPSFGIETQEKLANSKVLVVGAGGLGCPLLLQLTGMGMGCIGIVDEDTVALNNLHRQILFDEHGVGKNKSEEAKKKLTALNHDVSIVTYPIRISSKEAITIFPEYDIIVDGTDNFETRYMINDVCVILKKPLVYGAVFQYEGQVASFNIPLNNEYSLNYRDLFPTLPAPNEIPSCEEAGAYGVLTSIIGNFMANEVFHIITNIGTPLINTLLTFNALDYSTYKFTFHASENKTLFPQDIHSLLQFDYTSYCTNKSDLTKETLIALLEAKNTLLIDVRNEEETPPIEHLRHIQIPFYELDLKKELLQDYENLIFVCQGGTRSNKASAWAQEKFPYKKIYNYALGAKNLNENE